MKLRLAGFLLLLALWVAPASLGQCALCSSSANDAGARSQKALTRGAEVLLFPALGLMGLVVGVAFLYRNQH